MDVRTFMMEFVCSAINDTYRNSLDNRGHRFKNHGLPFLEGLEMLGAWLDDVR